MNWVVLIFWVGLVFWGWFAFSSARRLRWGRMSEQWPTAEGKVIKSKIEEVRSRHGTAYKPVVIYTYEIDGTVLEGNKVMFRQHKHSYDVARKITRRYRRGTIVTVYHHPRNPRVSVLEPGISRGNFGIVVFALVLLLAWILLGLLL
ncbi:MAG: DUF3592 domain-containing protein [Proteobacteria bacterium]|nr:DUF3592 domain-containing protein [Pseudomonadota bacterium]